MKSKFLGLFVISVMLFSCADDRTGLSEPASPSNFLLSQLNNESILLTWQDNSTKEDGFRIDRKFENFGWEIGVIWANEDATAAIDNGLSSFGEYQYRISAYVNYDYSDFEIASISFDDLAQLAAPSDLVLEQLDASSIQLSWQDNSSAEEGFILDRKIADGVWEEGYQVLAANTQTYLDENLSETGIYEYRLAAFRGDEISDPVQNSVLFSYDDISTITFSQPGQIVITPFEPQIIEVMLKDINGELVQRQYDVWFKFIACPIGTNLNNLAFGMGDSLSVVSLNGTANVTLYSGQHTGSVVIEAYALNLLGQKISAIKSNILTYASLPEVIDISHGGMDSGIEAGSGNWRIEVSANITDSFGNPVQNGTAVWFSLEDPNMALADPAWANIVAEAYIGNENAAGDTIAGYAFTQLTYNGSYTNEELIIKVEVNGFAGVISESFLTTMPLQFGSLTINAMPSQVSWQNTTPPYTNNEDYLASTIRVIVKDGQNNRINGQEIIFSSTLGSFQPSVPGTDPNLGWTETIDGQNGILDKVIFFYKYECPAPFPLPPGTSEATIMARISGLSNMQGTSVILYRYVD